MTRMRFTSTIAPTDWLAQAWGYRDGWGDQQRPPDRPAPVRALALAVIVGIAVAIAAGAYGRVHDPASETTIKWFMTSTLHLKAWLTTVALLLGVLQAVGALWMYGKLSKAAAPGWVGPAHRISGSLALLVSLPVAYHCLWSLGFDPDPGGGRRLMHSILGCLFYGAFATKVLVVRSDRMPRWALPVVGGVLFTLLVLVMAHQFLVVLPQHRSRGVSLRRLSDVFELVVGVAVVATVVLLFTNSPTPPPAASPTAVAAAAGIDGAALFGQRCASCHGGDGSGGIGPRLAGGRAIAQFPDPQDQIAVVTNGRGGMPGFAGRLTDEEIAAIVDSRARHSPTSPLEVECCESLRSPAVHGACPCWRSHRCVSWRNACSPMPPAPLVSNTWSAYGTRTRSTSMPASRA